MDKRSLRKFDELCLTPVRAMRPEEIRTLRQRERVSQAVFAMHLNQSLRGRSGYFDYRNSTKVFGDVRWHAEERLRAHLPKLSL